MQHVRLVAFAGVAAVFALLSMLFSTPAYAVIPPRPTGMVNDVADLLSADTEAGLEAKLRAYRDKTSIEIAVLIVPTLDGESHAQYAQEVWDAWHIGQAGEDNGVLLLVVPPPEKQVRIHTGRGIEPYITDLEAQGIIDTRIRPLNRQEKRAEAVVAGVDGIIAQLGDTPWAARTPPTHEASMDEGDVVCLLVVIVLIVCGIVLLMAHFSRPRRHSRWSGSSSGYDPGWSSGGSSGWSSGGDSGGSSGGDFSGFSGGDSGGGGAGGGSD